MTENASVRRVTVFGAGTMGSGIALTLARAGNQVSLVDPNADALERAMDVVRSSLALLVEVGTVDRDEVAPVLDRIVTTSAAREAAGEADVVVECITENRDAKRALYAQLDEWCPEHTIFASNTSFLNVFELVPARRAETTVITHWFAPAHIVPLVEVVRGEHTAAATITTVVAWLEAAGRVPIVMNKFIDGFCVNRLQRILGREIFFLLDNGYIDADMLDLAVKASIVPRAMVLGFVQRYDFTGLDLSWANLQNEDYEEPPLDNQPRTLAEHVRRGELGVKSGTGIFDYSDRPLVDVLRTRDERLLRVFAEFDDLIRDRV